MIFADNHYVFEGEVRSFTEYDTTPDGDGNHWAVDVDVLAGTRSEPRPVTDEELPWVVYYAFDRSRVGHWEQLRDEGAIRARIVALRQLFTRQQVIDFRARPHPDSQALSDAALNQMMKLIFDELELLAKGYAQLARLTTDPTQRSTLLDDITDT